VKSTDVVGSTVEDGGGDRGRGTAGILPISTCDGATCDNCENRPCYIGYNKENSCLVAWFVRGGDTALYARGPTLMACVTTRLDSARLGSMCDVCASKGCMARGTVDTRRREMCGG
jgi:hypothetical protein